MKQSGEKLKMMNVAAESVDKPKKVSSRASFEGVERTEEKTSKIVIDDRSNDKNSDTEMKEFASDELENLKNNHQINEKKIKLFLSQFMFL